MYWLASILLHEGHETSAASGGGGLGATEVAVVVLAAVGLAVGLYLLVGAIDVRPEAEDHEESPEDPAGSG